MSFAELWLKVKLSGLVTALCPVPVILGERVVAIPVVGVFPGGSEAAVGNGGVCLAPLV